MGLAQFVGLVLYVGLAQFVNLTYILHVVSRYVWEHLDVGYVQGMCDLLAPLLVILDDGRYTARA